MQVQGLSRSERRGCRCAYNAEVGAERIYRLCELRGLSPEALAKAICARAEAQANWWPELGGVDPSTIRDVLGTKDPPRVPGIRIRAAIAHYFNTTADQIWPTVEVSAPSTERIAA